MGFSVRDLLKIEILEAVKVLGGSNGLDNEIKGVTIIEAPDIAKFISGGEVLLTGLYAFKSCTAEAFKNYIYEFSKKDISALVLKKGRDVEFVDGKISILTELAEKYKIPVLEIPFEISFRDIMGPIMEHLFNEEVTRLKYFKTTHDNFVSLSLSFTSAENGYERILDTLEKLIGNPVALFNQNLSCLVTTSPDIKELVISGSAEELEHKLYSNYTYLKQEAAIKAGDQAKCRQYIIPLNIMFHMNMYLVVTERNRVVDTMDYIAIENAITVLLLEFSKQYSITELEKRFQSDIMNDILNGKIHSMKKLQQSTNLLGLSVNGCYRVIVFGLGSDEPGQAIDFSMKIEQTNILYDAIVKNFKNIKVQNDLNSIIVVQEVKPRQKQDTYRTEIRRTVENIQKSVSSNNPQLRVKAGVGKAVEGIINISESFKEAGNTLLLVDIIGDTLNDGRSRVVLSSDLGIFKLLCQLEDPDELLEFVPESLQRLYNYKKPQRDDLITTLKTYLDRNQNLTKTAQDLFIHYKTAVYRIDRISSITGIDFNNASEVLSVQIGLVIYKMIDNYSLDIV